METWDIASLDVQPRQPEVLRSDDETRVIAINLPAGEALLEHQVHERAWLVVASGEIEVEQGAFRPGRAPRGARPQRRSPDPAAVAVAG
jgi:redox-sensitive bicupin YhaK (pirin superfamily)